MPKNKTLQSQSIVTYSSHAEADGALANLIKNTSLSTNDTSYKQNIVPFKNKLNPKDVEKVSSLVQSFIDTDMTKESFHDKWRGLSPGTDEHLSTQSVYTILHTVKSNKLHESKNTLKDKPQVDLTVLKDTMAVFSHFRLPTEHTGSNAKGFVIMHTHGSKPSLHIATSKAPSHFDFDLFRRKLATSAGEEHAKNNPLDGTGTYKSLITEATKFTLNIVASPHASDVTIVSGTAPAEIERASQGKEQLKTDFNSLEGRKATNQASTAPQFAGFFSATAKAVKSDGSGILRARSPSPSRRIRKRTLSISSSADDHNSTIAKRTRSRILQD